MRGRIVCLLLVLVVGLGWGVGPGVCTESSPHLQPAAPAIPDAQQVQSVPMSQGQPPGGGTFHDIRGPVELPDSSTLIFWLLIALAVLIIAGLLFYFWKRRQKGEKQPQPDEIALAELTRLRRMMNPEQALSYAEQLSEILRRYIEVRFQLHSTRQTTREFFAGLSRNPQAAQSMEKHHDRLKGCLEQCDMAKFAHCLPGKAEMEAMEQAVRSFIRATARTVAEEGRR